MVVRKIDFLILDLTVKYTKKKILVLKKKEKSNTMSDTSPDFTYDLWCANYVCIKCKKEYTETNEDQKTARRCLWCLHLNYPDSEVSNNFKDHLKRVNLIFFLEENKM